MLFSGFWVYMLVTPFNLICQILTLSETTALCYITINLKKIQNITMCLFPAYLSYPSCFSLCFFSYSHPLLCFSNLISSLWSWFFDFVLSRTFVCKILWNFLSFILLFYYPPSTLSKIPFHSVILYLLTSFNFAEEHVKPHDVYSI